MRSILTKVSLLLTLFEIVLASVLELRGEKSPVLPDGFHCGDAIFTGNFLKEVTDEVKRKYRFGIFYSEKLSKSYSGPPFTRPYLAWPISHETKSYKKAMSGPYRAMIKENFEVFSVIAKRPHGIQECRMFGPVDKNDQKFHYKCGNDYFSFNMLMSAVAVACVQIQNIATHQFPARYDGPYFSEFGKQRYIYPIKVSGAYVHESDLNILMPKIDPGPYRVVLNSACRLVGAITIYNHGEAFMCAPTPAKR